MEITNIKESMPPPSLQESISSVSRKQGPSKEPAGSDGATAEFLKKISSGDTEVLKAVSETFDRLASNMRFNLQFEVNRDSGRVVIKVFDAEGNLIRQIPPEAMAALSSEMGVDIGLLLNTEL